MKSKITYNFENMMEMKKALIFVLCFAGMVVSSEPIRSSVGAENTSLIADEQTQWINPYVTDGLVAMWDSEWNILGGQHSETTTTWKDLAGNCDISVPNGVFLNGGYNLSVPSTFEFPFIFENATVEIVGEFITLGQSAGSIFFCLNENGIAIGRYRTLLITSLIRAGWGNKQFIFPSPYPSSISIGYINKGTLGTKQALFDGIKPTEGSEYWTQIPATRIGTGGCTGRIFCVRIYDRALTEEEQINNYLIDKERFNLP